MAWREKSNEQRSAFNHSIIMASPSSYHLINASPSTKPPTSLESITLHAPPVTDLWRKPSVPFVESDNAPSLVTSTTLHSFHAAEVTISANWGRLYDQGGLVLMLPASSPDQKASWVKTGIEIYNGNPNLGTVATPRLSTSDWSLIPLTETSVRVRVERGVVGGKLEPGLWVYLLKGDGEKLAVREVTWVRVRSVMLECSSTANSLTGFHTSSSRAPAPINPKSF